MDIRWSLVLLLFNVVFLRAQDPVEVAAGSTVNLQCKPSTNAPTVPTTYEWVDPQNRVRGTNKNLIISDFSYENQGVYTCRASQNVGGVITKNEKSILVRIKEQAFERQSLEVNVPATYDTYAGGILFLQCKSPVGDEKNLQFEWINPSGSIEPTSSFFKNTVRLQDSGRYTCRVKRLSDGVVAEGSTMLMVNPLPIKIEQVSGNISVGETVKLKCSIDKLKTENKVYTSFLYSWLDPMNRVISNKDEVNITLGDVSAFGKYRCNVSSESMIPPYTQMQDIELRYSNETVGGGRNVGERVVTTYTGSFSSNPQTLRYFNSLELNCRVHPSLAHISYQIFFNNKLLTTSNTHVIPRLGKEHLGVYTCHINGTDVMTGRYVTLKTEFKLPLDSKSTAIPKLTNPPGPQMFVRAGDKRELHCEIPTSAGVHGKDAIWYFNGKEITNDDVQTHELQVLPRLYVSIIVLKNIQVKNEGKYECKVKGEIKEAYVLVMATRHIEVSPVDEVRRTGDNRTLEFHCQIGGYRTKNKDIIWTFKSKETNQITSLDSRWVRSDDRTADETSFVVLPQAELQDAGAYICTEPVTGDTAQGVLNVISDLFLRSQYTVEVATGSIVNLQCKPSSNVSMYPTTYEWVDPQNKVRGTKVNLIIIDFSYENQGVYTCRATHIVGGVITKNEKSILVRIKEQAFERQTLEVHVPATYETYAGGIVFLQCKSPAGDENNLQFEWINPSGSTELTPSFFKNKVRLQETGRYTCRVKRLSDGVVAEGSTMVMVNPLPIKIEQVSGNISVGETVKLKCSIDKLKTENKVFTSFLYSWLDHINRVISNKDEVDITLGDVSTFGKYRCKVSSVTMIPPYTQMQDIELRYSNEIVGGGRNVGERVVTTYTGSFSSTPQTLKYFNSLELNCRVHPSLAHVSYQIFFNNQLLTTSNTHLIPRLGKEHLGVYTCHINGKNVMTGRDVTLKTEFSIQPDFKTIKNKLEKEQSIQN